MEVPEVVVNRLPQYVRALRQLQAQGNDIVSSQLLGHTLQMTPAQIRKDLSYFGRFGKQGRGYTIAYLLTELQDILQLDQEWNMAVVGVGPPRPGHHQLPRLRPGRLQSSGSL